MAAVAFTVAPKTASPAAPATGGTSPFAPTKAGVKLAPGDSLHYTPGKGYYAAPAAPAPAATTTSSAQSGLPVFTPGQISSDAAATAGQEVQASEAPLLGEQQTEDASSLATQKQAAQFNAAGSKLLSTLGPQTQGAFNTAATEEGNLASGVSAPMQATLSDEQAANAAYAKQLGATGENTPNTVDPSAFGDALYMGNGFIPASSLAGQGAAVGQWAAGLKAVNTDAGRAEEQSLQTAQTSEDEKIANQVATLAAKYPELFTAQEHADIVQNVDSFKANTELGNDNAKLVQGEQKITLTKQSNQIKLAYDQGTLAIRASSANTAAVRAATAANQIDASASKVAGHLVQKDGQALLTKTGKVIPITQSSLTSTELKQTPAGQYAAAVKTAVSMAGKPETIPAGLATLSKNNGGKYTIGKYILDPSLNPTSTESPKQSLTNGDAIPATTDDPTRAQKSGPSSFATAQSQIMAQYPKLTKAKARKALISAGIYPDGVRPSAVATQVAMIKAGLAHGTDIATLEQLALSHGVAQSVLQQALKKVRSETYTEGP